MTHPWMGFVHMCIFPPAIQLPYLLLHQHSIQHHSALVHLGYISNE